MRYNNLELENYQIDNSDDPEIINIQIDKVHDRRMKQKISKSKKNSNNKIEFATPIKKAKKSKRRQIRFADNFDY